MANTDGGIIVFGIDDPEKTNLKGIDRIFGIEESKELFDEIFHEIKRIIPPISNLSPGLFPYNITKKNIGLVRAGGYRNDLLVKHLREFPDPPNLDRNEGIRAMRNEMHKQNLFPPIFLTYPDLEDSVDVFLLNEERPSEWEKVYEYLKNNKYINNQEAREITGIVQIDKMSKLFKKWVQQGLLEMVTSRGNAPKYTKYKLSNRDELSI